MSLKTIILVVTLCNSFDIFTSSHTSYALLNQSYCKVSYCNYIAVHSDFSLIDKTWEKPFDRKIFQWKSYLQVLPQRISRTSWVSTFSLVLAPKRSPQMMIPVWASLILRLTKPAWPFSLQSWHLRKPCLGCYWIPWKRIKLMITLKPARIC